MVFTENTFSKCISKLNEINAILFFQPNFGLSMEMMDEIKKNFQHDEVVVIDFQDNEKNFISQLKEQLCDGFFSTKKIIKVYNFKPNARSKLKDEIKFLNEKKFNNKIVLFSAPELDGKSTFKNIFEKGEFTASISCYEDDEKTAEQYIIKYFKEKNVNIEQNAVKEIAQMLHGDRQLLKSECDKIMIYTNYNNITQEDVSKTMINEQEGDLIYFIDNVLCGDVKKAIKEFDLLEKQDIQMILLCRSFIKSIEDIIDIKKQIENGLDNENAIKNKFFFWKRTPYIKKAISISSIQLLEKYITILMQTEKMTKIYGNDIAKQFFIKNIILYKI